MNFKKDCEVINPKNLVNPHLAGDSLFEKRSGRGILLLHGLTATTNSVRPIASLLGELEWTISAPLLPGHGENLVIHKYHLCQ